jgi:hypothetical protein
MTLEALRRLGDAARDAGAVFHFSGDFTPSAIGALAASLRRRLDERGVRDPARKKIFATFIELAENVLHYAASADADPGEGCLRRGAIAMGTDGDRHWVACRNEVLTTHVPRLSVRIEAIRAMSPEELRAAYRRQLDDDTHEVDDVISRGAGLGLLTVARAACEPLECAFEPVPASGGRVTDFWLCARLAAAAPTAEIP